ncbi:DNA-directed RNA polymerase subunit omega [bacterium]|nr:DNA-directed RNA polymerase subunit omega [bacterium]
MSDISINYLTKKTKNIYEIVAVMCKRARQINDEQRLQIEMERDIVPGIENRDNEDFDEVEIDREALLKEHKKYPKPSTVAIQEMLEEKIEYRFINPEEEENK